MRHRNLHVLRRGSISLRLAFVFALLMISVFAGGAALVYVDVRSALDQSIDERLRLRWEDLTEGRHAASQSLQHQAELLVARTDGPAQAYSAHGKLLASTPSVTSIRLAETGQIRDRARHRGLVPQAHQGRSGRYAVYAGAPYGGAPVVVVATDLHDRNEALEDLLHELAIGAALVIALSTAIAYAITRGALAPVEQLRAQAAALATSGNRTMLDVPPTRDEIARLATTLNQLLDQLYGAVQRERRFVADAGHELRTPLAIAQGEIELMLDSADRTPDDRVALQTALDELHRLALLGQRLLDMGGISRSTLNLDEVDLVANVRATIDRQQRLHPERAASIELHSTGPVAIDGDAHLIEIAVTNLLDNSFRYGRAPVSVSVTSDVNQATIVVRDAGDGFPVEFMDNAFDPFTRVDQARTTHGAGIGLAIVRDIVDAHGGRAFIDADDMSAVVLTFPSTASPDA